MNKFKGLRVVLLLSFVVTVHGYCSTERKPAVQACQDNSATGSVVYLDSAGAINETSANCRCVFSHNDAISKKLVYISTYKNSFGGVQFEIGCRSFLDQFSQVGVNLESNSVIIFKKNTRPETISAGLCQLISASNPVFNFTITCYANTNVINTNPACATTAPPITTTTTTATTTTTTTPRPTTTAQLTTTAGSTTAAPLTSTQAPITTTQTPDRTTTQRVQPTTQFPASTDASNMDDDDDDGFDPLYYIIIFGILLVVLLFLIVAIAAWKCGRKTKEEPEQYLHPQPIDETDYYTRANQAYIPYEGVREEKQQYITQRPIENRVVHVPLSIGYATDDAMYASVERDRPRPEHQYTQHVVEQRVVEQPFEGDAVYFAEDDDFVPEPTTDAGVARIFVNNDHVDY